MFQAQHDSLKIERCKIEYGAGGNGAAGGIKWQRLTLTPEYTRTGGSFETDLAQLVPSQTYRARVELIPALKSKFSVPDATYLSCIGYSPVFPLFTSAVAAAPWGLAVLEKSPTSVVLVCTTNVPDGADVSKIQVEMDMGGGGPGGVFKGATGKC